MNQSTDILVVGAGISGLNLARLLHNKGHDFMLMEARDRVGGRVLSSPMTDPPQDHALDMGPSWFWHGQPHIKQLLNDLQLQSYYQFTQGSMLIEQADGQLLRRDGYNPMLGSYRVIGGMGAIATALASQLPTERLNLTHRLQRVEHQTNGIRAYFSTSPTNPEEIVCITTQHLVLAMPPRLVGQVSFTPELDDDQQQSLRSIPTWMAGQAKFAVLYERPFWRDMGLSGTVMSYIGPLQEIHDASPNDGSRGALTGFIGWPAPMRHAQAKFLESKIRHQLSNLFGPIAAQPQKILIQDWASNLGTTASSRDVTGATPMHPMQGMPKSLQRLGARNIYLSSAELDSLNGGLLEGALTMSQHTFNQLHTVDRLANTEVHPS